MIEDFLFLMMGHALADQGLQSEWVAKNKNRRNFPEGWYMVLISHGLIHGLLVYLITHNMILGALETILHSVIDFGKCEGKYRFLVDQILHTLCKAGYVVYMVWGLQ